MQSAFGYEAGKQYITQQNGVPVIVDDIVGAVPGFVEERKKCTTITSSQALYMGLRKGKTIRKDGKPLDDLSDEILQAGLDAGKNIIWETTGESTAWTTRITMTQAIDKGYRVVTVYPFVYTSTLVKRAGERQKKTGQIPAPAAAIRHTAAVAALNINSIFTYYFWRQDKKEIKEDCVYIYDNNGPTPGSQQMLIGLKNNYPKPIVLDVYKGCKPAFPAPGKKSSTDWDMSDPAAPVLKAFIETHAGERCKSSTDVSIKELFDPEGQDAHAATARVVPAATPGTAPAAVVPAAAPGTAPATVVPAAAPGAAPPPTAVAV
jgi:hypothetical protein